jgi:methylated-DNA-[protein]-cysteine S-methyltransferase
MREKIEADAVYKTMQSPVGTLVLLASERGLHAVNWVEERIVQAEGFKPDPEYPLLVETQKQLEEYFASQRKIFELPLAPRGTPFQLQIWKLLLDIPFGQTATYGELAVLAGDVNASRAVGMANNRNPIAIIVPCHRVIGRSGALVGFGGGLMNKSLLLDLESQFRLF